MASQWFYQVMGDEVGPVSAADLKSLAQRGVISPDTLVKTESSNWVPAEHLRGLFPVSNTTPLPMPVVSSAPVETKPPDLPTVLNPNLCDAKPVTRRLSGRSVAIGIAGSLAFVVLIAAIIAATRKTLSNPAVEAVKKGDAAAKRGYLDLAIVEYTEAIRLDPKNVLAYSGRGAVYERKDELDVVDQHHRRKAVADYSEAIRLDPKNVVAYCRRSILYESHAEAFHDMDELDKAITDCSERIRLDPKDAGAYWLRGEAYKSKGERDKAKADAVQSERLQMSRE